MQMCTMPHNFVFTLIEFPLDSLYLVSLLSNLNARSYVRGRPTEWSEYLSSLRIAQRNTTAEGTNDDDGRPGIAYVLSDLQTAKNKPAPAGTDTDEIPELSKVRPFHLGWPSRYMFSCIR